MFFCVWRNPDSKMYSILKYLLETSSENSRTWAVLLCHLSLRYGLPDPTECLKNDPPLKSVYKEHIHTKICAHYENTLIVKAENSSNMLYLNVSLTGLRGKRHPALLNIITTHEVKKARIHIKMLVEDYLTYEIKANQSGGQRVSRIRHEFVSSCFVALFDIVLVVVILSTDLKSRIDFVTFVYRLNK